MRRALCLTIVLLNTAALGAAEGRLEIRVVEKETERPLAARMHLKDARNKAIRPPKVPFWRDHFVFDGVIALELPLGTYTFELECGPEHKLNTGYFTLERNSNDTKTIEMQRFVDMKKEGWWSGDLHIHRAVEEIELHMRAEDLHVAPVMTWWNNRNQWQGRSLPKNPLVKFDNNRFYQLLAGEDEREGGALLYFNLSQPLPIAGSQREYPSPVKFLEQARETDGVHIDVEKPFWWDMPVWVATGKIDSMGLANNHQNRDGMLDNEAWGKPRPASSFPSPHGNGLWSQHIYYQLLNCGLRIPPSAGSASGVLPNPVGYNRVYVHTQSRPLVPIGHAQEKTSPTQTNPDQPLLDWNDWWQNLRLGRVVVTNGPLLRPRVHGLGADREGALPGHIFQADKGQEIELQIALNLSTRDPIDYLEVVQNGRTVHEVRLDQWAKSGGQLPPVKFDRSGWFLIRAVTGNQKTYRFASTGPYYVEIGYEPRISKKAAQFFVDWVHERAARIKLDDPGQKNEVLEHHRAARDYWQKKLAAANAD